MAILSPLLLWVAILIGSLCGVWMMVLGFKKHWAWGVGMALPQVAQLLFVIAFFRNAQPPEPVYTSIALIGAIIYLAFLIVAWSDAKQPFYWWLTSLLLMLLFSLTVFKSDQPMSDHVARVLRAKGTTDDQLARIEALRGTAGLFNRGRPSGPPEPRNARNPGAGPSRMATPPPVFQSKLPPPTVAPGQREMPQPGIYYLLQTVKTKNAKGVQVGLPGEKVILLERLPKGKMKVTVGNGVDFVVDAAQLTDDVSVARELEKQDFVLRGGQL